MSFDPIGDIQRKIEDIKSDLRRKIQIDILREVTRFQISRLMTLDPERAEQYGLALQNIGED